MVMMMKIMTMIDDDDDQAHLALLIMTNLSLLCIYNAKNYGTKSILK